MLLRWTVPMVTVLAVKPVLCPRRAGAVVVVGVWVQVTTSVGGWDLVGLLSLSLAGVVWVGGHLVVLAHPPVPLGRRAHRVRQSLELGH